MALFRSLIIVGLGMILLGGSPLAAADLDPPKMPPNLTPQQELRTRQFYNAVYRKFNGRANDEFAVILCKSTITATEPGLIETLGLVLGVMWDATTLPIQIVDSNFPGYLKNQKELPHTRYSRTEAFEVVAVQGRRAAADRVYMHYYDIFIAPPADPNVRVAPSWLLIGHGQKRIPDRLEKMKRHPWGLHPALALEIDRFLAQQ